MDSTVGLRPHGRVQVRSHGLWPGLAQRGCWARAAPVTPSGALASARDGSTEVAGFIAGCSPGVIELDLIGGSQSQVKFFLIINGDLKQKKTIR